MIVFAGALAAAASPAVAHGERPHRHKQPETERVSAEPFGSIPKGPLQIIISVDQQKLHLYSNGTHMADTPVATGVPDHPTPLGIFSIIQKSRYHRSNIYSDAPMPYMERITWSGVALHEGGNLGHPASHGCIRMSHDFAMRLWALTRLGVRVIITGPELRPQEFADTHLFAHEEKPTAPIPMASALVAPVTAKLFKTAQTVDGGNTTDALHEDGKDAAGTEPVRDALDPPASVAADAQPNPPSGTETDGAAPVAAPNNLPLPSKPVDITHASKAPIAIFVSRKDKKIYVRQDFSPIFETPISIEHPERPLGTHVFTAMEYLEDHASFRWNVVSLPGEQAKTARKLEYETKFGRCAKATRVGERAARPLSDPPPPQSPQQALARIEIPQDVIDRISQLIVPGSSLIVSDQGLGDETGEGTDFIVVTQ